MNTFKKEASCISGIGIKTFISGSPCRRSCLPVPEENLKAEDSRVKRHGIDWDWADFSHRLYQSKQ